MLLSIITQASKLTDSLGLGDLIAYTISIATMYGIAVRSATKRTKKLEGVVSRKVDASEFSAYKSDHKEIHDRDFKESEHIRKRIDAIYDHLINNK